MLGHVQVEHEADQRTLQAGAQPDVEREPGARHAGGAREVEQPELLADFDVTLGLEGKLAGRALRADDLVAGGVGARGQAGVRQVRDAEQAFAHGGLDLAHLRVHGRDAVAQFAHGLADGRRVLALRLELADFFGDSVELVLELLDLSHQGAPLPVGLNHGIQVLGRVTAAGKARADNGFLVADQLDVKHGRSPSVTWLAWYTSAQPDAIRRRSRRFRIARRAGLAYERRAMTQDSQNPAVPDADADRMLQVAAGSQTAFAELVRTHQNSLLNFFVRMGAYSGAEDLVQETFIRLYRYRDRYRPSARFTTFLYVLARHVWADQARRSWRKGRLETGLEDEARIVERRDATDKPHHLDVEAALGRLSPKLKEVLVLNVYQGLRYQEIADVLDVPLGTVKSRINLAIQEMRKLLDEA